VPTTWSSTKYFIPFIYWKNAYHSTLCARFGRTGVVVGLGTLLSRLHCSTIHKRSHFPIKVRAAIFLLNWVGIMFEQVLHRSNRYFSMTMSGIILPLLLVDCSMLSISLEYYLVFGVLIVSCITLRVLRLGGWFNCPKWPCHRAVSFAGGQIPIRGQTPGSSRVSLSWTVPWSWYWRRDCTL